MDMDPDLDMDLDMGLDMDQNPDLDLYMDLDQTQPQALDPHPTHKNTMTQPLYTRDLIRILQQEHNLPRRQATAYAQTFLKAIRDIPPNTPLTLRNLGTFTRYTRPERPARNPKTGETMMAEEKETLRFRPSKNMYT